MAEGLRILEEAGGFQAEPIAAASSPTPTMLGGDRAAFSAYVGGQKIYKCPGDKGENTLFKRVRTRSYGLNAFMNDVD